MNNFLLTYYMNHISRSTSSEGLKDTISQNRLFFFTLNKPILYSEFMRKTSLYNNASMCEGNQRALE